MKKYSYICIKFTDFRREKFQNREVKYFFVLYCVGKGRKVPERDNVMKKPGHICKKNQQLVVLTNKNRKIQGIFAENLENRSGKRKEAKENLERKKYIFFLSDNDIKRKKINLLKYSFFL